MNGQKDWAALLGRILLAGIFVISGFGKITGFEGTAGEIAIAITPIFHGYWASPPDQMMAEQINFMKNVSILGGSLLLSAFGPGRYSIDKA
jgi:putative oxidoreductase